MDEILKICRRYKTLDGDDVLLLSKATFTVRRFKELASSNFNKIMNQDCVAETNQRKKGIIQLMQYLLIDEETKIMGIINWKSPQEGIDCQILKSGSKSWQKGKLQIELNKSSQSWKKQVCIKFVLINQLNLYRL
jgi:KGK domain